jgi:hypothetical protein
VGEEEEVTVVREAEMVRNVDGTRTTVSAREGCGEERNNQKKMREERQYERSRGQEAQDARG